MGEGADQNVDEPVEVTCYAGGTADERPRLVHVAGRRREVARVLERWIESAWDPAGGRRRWFRVAFRDGGEAMIYQDLALDMWFLHRPPRHDAGHSGSGATSS